MQNPPATPRDLRILTQTITAVETAGRVLRERFSPQNRVHDMRTLLAAIDANDAASVRVLRPALELAHPSAAWDEDEEGRGPLGAGEWWVVDAAEGNVNHTHGSTGWGVTATLVRDDAPVLTAVHLPLSGETYSAAAGHGAFRDGRPIRVSDKSELAAALVSTGQAKPGEAPDIRRLLSASVDRMLDHALLVSTAVPATMQLVPVAAGRTDAFWQYGQVRSGLLAGALLVEEAGGVVLDTQGAPWDLSRADFLATTPHLAAAIVGILSPLH
jgi:myo-inositol-1(or 4)-monophosphatase